MEKTFMDFSLLSRMLREPSERKSSEESQIEREVIRKLSCRERLSRAENMKSVCFRMYEVNGMSWRKIRVRLETMIICMGEKIPD